MRLYRALLTLYPKSFRAEYGGEMAAVFDLRRRAASGWAERMRVWLAEAGDVLAGAARGTRGPRPPGSALHDTRAVASAGLCGHRDPGHRARCRRQHRRLLRRGLRAGPSPAVSRLRPAGQAVGGGAGLWAAGAVAAELPRLEGVELGLRRHGRLPSHRKQPGGRRRARPARGRRRHGRHPRHAPGAGRAGPDCSRRPTIARARPAR